MRASPADYEFVEASDLAQALSLLSAQEGWRPIAGGTDLMVLFNSGILTYKRILSIRKLTELTRISHTQDAVCIGAGATYAAIQRTGILVDEFPLLCQAAGWTGSVANQNRGTLGGNIANGSPAADSPPALLVYDAELELISSRGVRRVPYSNFHLGYKKMNLAADELLYAIHIPRTKRTLRQYARKVGSRKAQAISKVCFHGVIHLDGNSIRDVRLALGSVAPYPLRCRKVEQCLLGQRPSPSLIEAARQKLSEDISPIDDIRSTASYRSLVSQNLLSDFLEQLL
jgi:CO/xanthine dehydrogenase FAD-binding subunit